MAKSSYLCGKCERSGTFYCTHCDGTCDYVDKTWVMPDKEYHKIRKDICNTMTDAKKTFLDYVKRDVYMTKEALTGMRIIIDPREMVKDVIFNDPATIVYWTDGTKTVVKAQDDEFDPEKGLAMAFSKKLFGNKGNYYNVFRQWLEPYWQKKAEEADEEIANLWRMLMDATTSVADKLNAYAMTMREENKNGEESIKDAAKETYNPVEEAYMQINNFLNGKGSLDLDEIRGLLGEALDDTSEGDARVKIQRYYDDTLIFETREDAEETLSQMNQLLEKDGVVSVADMFDLVDMKAYRYPATTRGWLSLEKAKVKRVRNGYIIDLPEPFPIV